MLPLMVRPISLRIRHNEATANARRILRRLDAEMTARNRVKHFASKAFLAASELRSVIEELPASSDRARWQDEINRIKATLLRIGKGLR